MRGGRHYWQAALLEESAQATGAEQQRSTCCIIIQEYKSLRPYSSGRMGSEKLEVR